MPYFKTQDNKIHFIDDPVVESFRRGDELDTPAFKVLADAIEITEQEAKDLTAPSKEEVERQAAAEKEAALNALDLQSIRALREYVAAQQDAPQKLKDIESAAIKARTS